MNSSCAICCSRLSASDDIFATKCGHIFHLPCLSQWLDRKKTCPQCRQMTRQSDIFRLYFNVCSNDSVIEDASGLQEQMDNLKFQMLLRDEDIKNITNTAAKAQAQAKSLRTEVLKLEAELTQKISAIHALKEQAKFLKKSSDEGLAYQEQVAALKLQIADLRNTHTIITASNEDANRVIDATNDPQRLAVYLSTLKRELTTCMKSRKDYRQMIRQLKEEGHKLREENQALVRNAELAQDTINQVKHSSQSLRKRLLSSSSVDHQESQKSILRFGAAGSTKMPDETDKDEENIPSLPFKIDNLLGAKKNITKSNAGISSSSILAKKPRIAPSHSALMGKCDEYYKSDGLGSYVKVDQFPTGNGTRKKTTLPKYKSSPPSYCLKMDNFVDLTS